MEYKILTVLVTIGLATTVLGQNQVVRPGITPDQKFLYGLDVAYDRISYLLTLNKTKKAEKGLKIARERLAEAKALEEQGLHRASNRAEKRAEKMLEKVHRDVPEEARRMGVPKRPEEIERGIELPPRKCRGRPHPMCVGHWEIENGRCKWVCE